MIIKEKFTLLKGVPNVLSISSTLIKKHSVPNGVRNLVYAIQPLLDKTKHFTKDKIAEIILSPEHRKRIAIVNLPDYILHVSYNVPTRQMILNLTPFGVDDISRINSINCYAYLVYAISFRELVTEKLKVNESYASTIINYYLSLFVRLFGKQYGLLGMYENEVVKLKFLTSCYVLSSFFGITGNEVFRRSSIIAPVDYKEILSELSKYNFSLVEDFIKSLSGLKVLTGINSWTFTDRIIKILGADFLPAIEDVSRFISTISTSSITGSSLVRTFLQTAYNREEYNKLLEISKLLFR